jgi:hypothetical protein
LLRARKLSFKSARENYAIIPADPQCLHVVLFSGSFKPTV